MEFVNDLYKPVFETYVVWHPKFSMGNEIADFLYVNFTRNIQNQILYRGPSIPVYFRSTAMGGGNHPLPIPSNASNVAIIFLIDDEWIIDDQWELYIEEICKKYHQNASVRLYPVAISKLALNQKYLGSRNCFRWYEHSSNIAQAKKELLRNLTHDFTRQLRAAENGVSFEQVESIKLFLSHAKSDGAELALEFMNFIHSKTAMNTFFDANDIPTSSTFAEVILENIYKCAIIVIQTNEYSSRPWCQREVLAAKSKKVPIVVANAVTEGEVRSFPYLGNLPTIRLKDDNIDDVVDLALSEVLRCVHLRMHFKNYIQSMAIPEDRVQVLTNSPEILDIHNFIQNNESGSVDRTVFLYPDPPLGYEELLILNQYQSGYTYITPTLLPITNFEQSIQSDKTENKLFEEITIGISISESADATSLGLGSKHLHDALVEFARYFIANGASLAYGGDYREDGFTKTLFELFKTYNPEYIDPNQKFSSFLSWPIHRDISVKTRAEYKTVFRIFDVDAPDELFGNKDQYIQPDTPLNKFLWASALTKMRKFMNEQIHVRVLLGGRSTGFLGIYPGVIEEAYFALSKGVPVYLIGAFGGATKAVIDALQGMTNPVLTKEFHMRDEKYKEMISQHQVDANYEKLFEFFKGLGVNGLQNGLTEIENHRLFETTHLPEMISLVLKGITNSAIRKKETQS